MKKDVNLMLFSLVIFLLISIAAITLYYQETYKSLDISYREAMDRVTDTECRLNETMEEVGRKSDELSEREGELISIINELNISKQKISSLSGYYDSIRGQKEDLESRVDVAESDRARYMLNLDEKTQELGVCKKDKKLFSDELSDANTRITQAKGKVQENMSRLIHTMGMDLDETDSLINDKLFDYLNDIEDDLDKCNCSANRMDNLREGIEDIERAVTRSKNLLNKMNYIIMKLRDILVAV